jgi:hypothetical protein
VVGFDGMINLRREVLVMLDRVDKLCTFEHFLKCPVPSEIVYKEIEWKNIIFMRSYIKRK